MPLAQTYTALSPAPVVAATVLAQIEPFAYLGVVDPQANLEKTGPEILARLGPVPGET